MNKIVAVLDGGSHAFEDSLGVLNFHIQKWLFFIIMFTVGITTFWYSCCLYDFYVLIVYLSIPHTRTSNEAVFPAMEINKFRLTERNVDVSIIIGVMIKK